MQQQSAFELSLPIVAAALGRKCGVSIELGGNIACTDGTRICLPALGSEAAEHEREILGLLCHECGHVRFSNMKEFAKQKSTPFEHAIDNALEDVRIEREMNRIYPGAEALFEAAHQKAVEKLTAKLRVSERELIPLWLLCSAESHLLHRAWLQPLEQKLRRKMETTFGAELTEKLRFAALKVDKASSTGDVRKLRKEIMKLLGDARSNGFSPSDGAHECNSTLNEEKNSSVSKTSLSRTNASEELSPEASKSNEQFLLQKKHEQTAPDGLSDPLDQKRDDETLTAQSSSGNGTSKRATSQAIRAAARAAAQSLALSEVLDHQDQVNANPLDLSQAFKQLRASGNHGYHRLVLSGDIRPRRGNTAQGQKRLKQARADSVSLRLALQGLVQSRALTGCRYSDRGRRISSIRLARLAAGNTCVFEHRSERPDPNAAIHVLLDMSWSMGRKGADLALRAALGLILGLQSIRGVDPALTVFPGNACGHPNYAVCPLVRHGERIEQIDPAELAYVKNAGSTPALEALTAARLALKPRAKPSKALFFITDAQIDPRTCTQVLADMRKEGIRLFGIQIGKTNDLASLIPDAVLIDDIKDLEGALFTFAKQLLL